MPRSAPRSARAGRARRVLVLEAAPKFYRGGNTRHTRNMRCAHDAATEILDRPLHRRGILRRSLARDGGRDRRGARAPHDPRIEGFLDWIVEQGVRWQPSLGGTLIARPHQFLLPRRRARHAERALPRRPRSSASRSPMRARSSISTIEDGMFLSATVARGGERLEVRAATLVAASGGFEANIEWMKEYWGEQARQFPHPRHALQSRLACCKLLLAKGVQRGRRSDAMPRGRDRCARAEIRRRHHHAARLRHLRHRGEQGCAPLLRRGRGHLAEALRDLGPPHRRPAGPDRLYRLRCVLASTCSCRRSIPPFEAQTIARARERSSSSIPTPSKRRWPSSTRPCGRAHSITPSSMIAAPRGSCRRNPIGRGASSAPPSTPIRCAPASPSPISARG